MAYILVIEDSQEILENIVEILTLEQFEVDSARNGVEGLALIQQRHPDLILCDVRMPHLDGFGVLAALQDNPATAKIPFFFLTATADKESIKSGLAQGATGYLTKPFMPTELLTRIQDTLMAKSYGY